MVVGATTSVGGYEVGLYFIVKSTKDGNPAWTLNINTASAVFFFIYTQYISIRLFICQYIVSYFYLIHKNYIYT